MLPKPPPTPGISRAILDIQHTQKKFIENEKKSTMAIGKPKANMQEEVNVGLLGLLGERVQCLHVLLVRHSHDISDPVARLVQPYLCDSLTDSELHGVTTHTRPAREWLCVLILTIGIYYPLYTLPVAGGMFR